MGMQSALNLNPPVPVRLDAPANGADVDAAGIGSGGARSAQVIPNYGHFGAILEGQEGDKEKVFHRDEYLYGEAESSGWPIPLPAVSCGAPFTTVRGCKCERKALRTHCDERSCSEDYCREKIRQRRALKFERRFEAWREGRAAIYTVFTVPPRLRAKAADRKVWKSWIDRLVRFMKKELGFSYGLERTDTRGDSKDVWHPHINLLWVRHHGLHGFLEETELDALKARWARIIGEDDWASINVYTAYSHEKGKLWHWYRYMGRTWPTWETEFPYHLRPKWLGGIGKTPKKEANDGCCEDCGAKVVMLSAIAGGDLRRFVAMSYDEIVQEKEAQEFDRALRCEKQWRRGAG